jgi:hypothetical protein
VRPAAVAVIGKVACPLLTVEVPNRVEPEKKFTPPVAVVGATAATRFTVCPTVGKAGLVVMPVDVLALLTVCEAPFDVLAALLASPL